MKDNVIDIVDALVCARWREFGDEPDEEKYCPGFTIIVKLFYLLECWYFQLHKKRLSDLEWKYYNHGPYSQEVESMLFDARMLEGANRERRFRRVFRRHRGESPEVTDEIKRLVDHIVKDWGDRDLYEVLDHVYYETAPMRDVTRGQVLDLSLALDDVARPRSAVPSLFTAAEARSIKKKVRNRPRSKGIRVRYLSAEDSDLLQALEGMNKYE